MFTEWVTNADLGSRLDTDWYTPEFVSAARCLAESEYPRKPMGDIIAKESPITYGILQPGEFVEKDGIPMIRAVDLDNPFVNEPSVRLVTSEIESPYRRSRILMDDVLLSIMGTLGAVGVYSGPWPYANINQAIARIRVGDSADPYYVAAFMMSEIGQLIFGREAAGTVQRRFNIEDLYKVQILQATPEIQQAVGNKLRKAFALRKKAVLARACAKQMLADSFGQIDQSAETPTFVSEMRIETGRLDAKFYSRRFLGARKVAHRLSSGRRLRDDVCEYSNGAEIRDFTKDGRPYLCVMNMGCDDLDVANAPRIALSNSVPKKAMIQPGDVIVVRTGSLGQAVSITESDVIENPAISSHFIRLVLKEPSRAGFIAAFLSSTLGNLLQEQIAYGAVQLQISQDELLDIPIPQFTSEVEESISRNITHWREWRFEMRTLVEEVVRDVDSLIENKQYEERILREGAEASEWLKVNQPEFLRTAKTTND